MNKRARESLLPPKVYDRTLPQRQLPSTNADIWIGRWPPKSEVPLRVCWHTDSRFGILSHCFESLDVEVGGVLLGKAFRTPASTEANDLLINFVEIKSSIEANRTNAGQGHLQFTQETWAEINLERDRDYPDYDIIGWYHSHPGHGVFLSAHDLFIHNHFFSQPFQLALVIDTHLKKGAFFVGSESQGGPYKSEVFGWDQRFVELFLRSPQLRYHNTHNTTSSPIREQIGVPEKQKVVKVEEDDMSTVVLDRTTKSLGWVGGALIAGMCAFGFIGWLIVPIAKSAFKISKMSDIILFCSIIILSLLISCIFLCELFWPDLRGKLFNMRTIIASVLGALILWVLSQLLSSMSIEAVNLILVSVAVGGAVFASFVMWYAIKNLRSHHR